MAQEDVVASLREMTGLSRSVGCEALSADVGGPWYPGLMTNANDNERSGSDSPQTSAAKDPEDWVTGDEPPTGPQLSYLETLAREAGEELPSDLTKAQASELIDRLQEKTGRGS